MHMSRLQVKKHTRSETMDVDEVRRERSFEFGQALACCDQFFHIVACKCGPKWKAIHRNTSILVFRGKIRRVLPCHDDDLMPALLQVAKKIRGKHLRTSYVRPKQ